MAFGQDYNPADILMRPEGRVGMPYLGSGSPFNFGKPDVRPGGFGGDARGSSFGARKSAKSATAPAPPFGTLAPESIRATGGGPFDAAYRQNLATYGGSPFSRPGGSMSFNPTDPNTFPGQPTGGGNAPLPGMPFSLLDMALSGQGFGWTPPPSAAPSATHPGRFGDLQFWLDRFLRGGQRGRFGSVV